MVYIKHEHNNPIVTDYYLDTIEQALQESGYETSSIKSWDDIRISKNDLVVVITATEAFKMYRKGISYIFWAQGIWPEESLLRNNSRIRFLITSFVEKKALKHAKYIFLVSEAQKTFYEHKYNFMLSNCYIMPCSNEALHENQFSVEGKYSNNVFVYAGSINAWQCFEETIKLYSEIEKRTKNAKLILLVKEKETALRMLRKYNVKRFEIDYVPVNELKIRLAGVKFGFILREDTPINNVATPTKLMTYVANGIIPVYSNCLQGLHSIMDDTSYKVVLNNNEDYESILKMISQRIDATDILRDYLLIYRNNYDRAENIKRIIESMNFVKKK